MPYATVNGVTIHYREAGSGPAALFLHGFPLDHTMWLDQLGGVAHLRRCIAVDMRGFGRSGRKYLEPLTMERHADDAAALLGALGEDQADVVALSMGGYVALAMWERHPQVIGSLTLIDTKAGADSEEGKAGRDASAGHLVAAGKDAWGGELLDKLVAEDASLVVRARLRSMIGRTSYDTIVAALAGMRDRSDHTALLETITVPSLVVVGEHDALTPPDEAEAMAEAIPEASLAIVPGAGHMSPIEVPAVVNEALAGFFGGRVAVTSADTIRVGQFDALMLSVAEGWSTGDVGQALAAFTEDATFSEPPGRTVLSGSDALRGYFESLGTTYAMQWHHLWFDTEGQVGAGEYTLRLRGDADAVHGVAVVELRDGKIGTWRQYQRFGPADVDEFRISAG